MREEFKQFARGRPCENRITLSAQELKGFIGYNARGTLVIIHLIVRMIVSKFERIDSVNSLASIAGTNGFLGGSRSYQYATYARLLGARAGDLQICLRDSKVASGVSIGYQLQQFIPNNITGLALECRSVIKK